MSIVATFLKELEMLIREIMALKPGDVVSCAEDFPNAIVLILTVDSSSEMVTFFQRHSGDDYLCLREVTWGNLARTKYRIMKNEKSQTMMELAEMTVALFDDLRGSLKEIPQFKLPWVVTK